MLKKNVHLALASNSPWRKTNTINFSISKTVIFWSVIHVLAGKYVQCFGGTCRLLLHGIRVDPYPANYSRTSLIRTCKKSG
jgi:hypothetical protein